MMTKPMTMDSVTDSLAAGRHLEAAAKYYLLHSGNVTFETALAHVESISSRVKTWNNQDIVVPPTQIYSAYISNEQVDRIIAELNRSDIHCAAVILREALCANGRHFTYGVCSLYMANAHKEILKIIGTPNTMNRARKLRLSDYVSELVRNYSPK
jgi:hypothetical protein